MDAVELLTLQHTEVRHLFQKLERHPERDAQRSIFQQIAADLAVHTTLEEETFYPAVYTAEMEDRLHVAMAEHLAIKRLLVDSKEMAPDDSSFDATMKVLLAQLEHHFRKEESQLFPDVRRRLSASALEDLGAKMDPGFATRAVSPRRLAVECRPETGR